jgi:hypothetical protein
MFHPMLGLPGSGKTTYLAALWHLIDAGETETCFRLDKLVGDHSYLNRIVEAWRRCEEVPRTSMGAEEQSLSVHVHSAFDNSRLVLSFPDLSGETFEHQFARRVCTDAFVKSFEGNGGVVLFVNADRRSDGITIVDIQTALSGEEPTAEEGTAPAATPWRHSCVPEQVQLVDLLQFLQRPPFEQRRRRIAILISAWDVVIPNTLQPAEWLSREMPLLDQFLRNNPESFDARIYGVSAQGGSVKGDSRMQLLRMSRASLRIRCVGPDVSEHDLTSPLMWLSGER